jgi:hypothetical protein
LVVIAFTVAVLIALASVSEFWRDFVGFFSLFVTVLGLGYTIYQVSLIETAALAAEKAAQEARGESRRRLLQFTAASVHRLVSAAASNLERREWAKAEIRLDDLADQAAQIDSQEDEWKQLVQQLRDAAVSCRALESGRRKKPFHEKWGTLLTDLRTRLDAHFGPLQRN